MDYAFWRIVFSALRARFSPKQSIIMERSPFNRKSSSLIKIQWWLTTRSFNREVAQKLFTLMKKIKKHWELFCVHRTPAFRIPINILPPQLSNCKKHFEENFYVVSKMIRLNKLLNCNMVTLTDQIVVETRGVNLNMLTSTSNYLRPQNLHILFLYCMKCGVLLCENQEMFFKSNYSIPLNFIKYSKLFLIEDVET